MTTATKTKPKTFIAKGTDLRLVATPADVRRDQRGQLIETVQGSSVQFDHHRLEVSEDEQIDYLGEQIPVVEFLRNHPGFNVDFWEVGNAPGEAKPTIPEQHARIIRAAAEGDHEAIYEIAREERAGHNREVVVVAAENALEAVSGAKTDE